jgi:hypothetical protein
MLEAIAKKFEEKVDCDTQSPNGRFPFADAGVDFYPI